MNPFEKWGVRSLSPSQLNKPPALWLLTRFADAANDVGAKAWRGRAVELALDAFFEGKPAEGCLLEALRSFDETVQAEVTNWGVVPGDDIVKERELLASYVEQALGYAAEMAPPISRQQRVEVFLDGIEVPIAGIYDYRFAEPEAFVLDLKTTSKMPTAPRDHDVRQVALYAVAEGVKAGLLYVTPKRAETKWLTDEQIKEAIADLHTRARTRRNLLAITSSPRQLAKYIEPDFGDFRWTPALKAAARELWGIKP